MADDAARNLQYEYKAVSICLLGYSILSSAVELFSSGFLFISTKYERISSFGILFSF